MPGADPTELDPTIQNAPVVPIVRVTLVVDSPMTAWPRLIRRPRARTFAPLVLICFASAAADDHSLPAGAAADTGVVLEGSLVIRLTAELGSNHRSERDAAERQLRELGPDVLPWLPATASIQDVAVRETVDRIRTDLESEAARQAAEPSRLTLNGSSDLRTLVERLADATHNPLAVAHALDNRTLDVAWEYETFWNAVTDIERRTGLVAQPDAGRDRLELVRQFPAGADQMSRPLARGAAGPCRVDVMQVTIKPSQIDASKQILQLRWTLQTEPRLRPLYLILADANCQLEIDGQQAPPLSPDSRRELPVDRWRGCVIDTSFDLPSGSAPRQVQFGASATLKVAALPLPLVFEDLVHRTIAVQRHGGVSAVVRQIRFSDDDHTLRLRVTIAYDRGGDEFESHRTWIYQNAAWLISKGQAPVRPTGVDLVQIDPTGGVLEYEFSDLHGEPASYQFVYEAPTLVVDVPVKFSGLEAPLNLSTPQR